MEVTRFLPLVGRMLVGLPLLVSGFGKLAAFGPTTQRTSAVWACPWPRWAGQLPLPSKLAVGLLILGFRVREVEPCGVHPGSGDLLSP